VSTDDRIRAATQATAATVREIRPLALPDELPAPARRPRRARRSSRSGPGRGTRLNGRGPRDWGSWLIPLAAAVAVVAAAATLVAVRSLSGAGSGSQSTPAATSTSTTSLSNGVPQYFVEINNIVGSSVRGVAKGDAFVGDTSTGKPLAVFKPPSDGGFNEVAGSSDGRTFVLEAGTRSGQPEDIWYVLRLTPGAARPVQLTRIPIASPPAHAFLEGLAVSPDGRTLAIMLQAAGTTAKGGVQMSASGPATLRTYSLTTDQVLRTWTAPVSDSSLFAFDDLSWLDDGHTLAFVYPAMATQRYVRTLNTDNRGTNLITDSRTVFSVPTGHTCDAPLLMTADGKSVICGNFGPNNGWCTTGQLAVTAYSVATGKLERTLYQYKGGCNFGTATVVWAKSSTLAIGWIALSKPVSRDPPITNMVGVIAPGKFTSLSNIPVGRGGYEMPSMIAF
jgi:hypothetical protein